MQIDVLLSPKELPVRIKDQPILAIGIDVLRATSAMVTAFHCGVKAIIPVDSTAEGRNLLTQKPSCLLTGEEYGLKPEGFHFGNSPLDYLDSKNQLLNQTLITSTTNGTRLLKLLETHLDHPNDHILIGALLNRKALSEYIYQSGYTHIVFCCAGSYGQVALEDVACAGYLVKALRQTLDCLYELGDGAVIALSSIEPYQTPLDAFQASHHGQYLASIGFEADIAFCAQGDTYHAGVSVYSQGLIQSVPVPLSVECS